MLTFMPEFALSKSGTSFFRSVIEGLSTEPTVTVVVPAPPPPPPAPPEHAPASSAAASPRMMRVLCPPMDPNFLSPISVTSCCRAGCAGTRASMTTLSKDNVVIHSTDRVRLQQENSGRARLRQASDLGGQR